MPKKTLKTKKTTALAIRKEDMPAVQAERLIAQAITQNVSVETMERLLAMRKDLKAEFAKELFDNAMAKLQGELPIIKKTKSVNTKAGVRAYGYAPLEEIAKQTKEIIQKNGFSYLIKTEMVKDEKGIIIGVKSVCIAKHQGGHSEESPMEVPLGTKTDIMSQSQVVAAASTFSKRYAFCNAFGILTADDDTDGKIDKTKTPANIKTPDVQKLFVQALKNIRQQKDKVVLADWRKKISGSKLYPKDKQDILLTQIDDRLKEI